MSGTKLGGQHTLVTNKLRHGKDFYKKIGHIGGSTPHPETRYWYKNRIAAAEAGYKGGKKSRRPKKV